MRRTFIAPLEEWLISKDRKPLVIRGARQVGKTWLVRELAAISTKKLIEFNFEKTPGLVSLFKSNDPHEIVRKIEERFSIKIEPSNSILFLDEIQSQPELLAKLRWFYEDMPELPVIAAGSLLELILGTHSFSMPVGRISFLYLEPLTFIEFLLALEKDRLVDVIKNFKWGNEINEAVHEELMRLFKHYVYIGGLPSAVENWINNYSLEKINAIHQDLMGSYRADFGKYNVKVSDKTLNTILDAIPRLLGDKVVFSKLDLTVSIEKNKEGFNLLSQARIIHKVQATAANGMPLQAEINPKFMKALLLDVGLCSTELGLTLDSLEDLEELIMVNKGAIAEQVTGQLLRTLQPWYIAPSLYYWVRLQQGSDAEVDYVIQHKGKIIPIEVKAGSEGTLRSLHQFMKLKKLSHAVRVYSGIPLINNIGVKDKDGTAIKYELWSVPFYLISELPKLFTK